MRTRAVRMIVSIVAVVCVLMGLPGAFFASASIWSSEQRNLDVQAQLVLQNIERRRAVGEGNDPATLASLVADQANSRGGELGYRIKVPEANLVTNSKVFPGRTITALASERRFRAAGDVGVERSEPHRVDVRAVRRGHGCLHGDRLVARALTVA